MTASPDASGPTILVTPLSEQTNGYTEEFPIHDQRAADLVIADPVLAEPIPRQLTAADLILMSTRPIIVDSKGNALVGNWSATKKLTPPENAFGHAMKHRSEFPEYSSDSEYVEKAQKFVVNPPADVLTKTRGNGDVLLYDPKSNTFAVKTSSGVAKTMFRPVDGINYWNRQ